MGHPRLAVVVPADTVVDGTRVLARIAFLHDAEEAVPVGLALRAHDVELVRHRPPDVAVRREPGHAVAQVAVVRLGRHPVEAPAAAIVGMEQDEVGLDAELHELGDARLEVAPEGGLEPLEVPRSVIASLERKVDGLDLVVDVPLGEHAHAQLVEGGVAQGLERLLLECVALVGPGVARGADLAIGRAVRVAEVEPVGHVHRTVVAGGGGRAGELAGPAVQLRAVAPGRIAPLALHVRHEARAEHAVAVVETLNEHVAMAVAEACLQLHVGKRVAGGLRPQLQLENSPQFHRLSRHTVSSQP